jgi:hypothetical protein
VPAQRIVIARLDEPPDTSRFERCAEHETSRALATMTARLLAKRRALGDAAAHGPSLERLLGNLHRLQNPQMNAYRHDTEGCIVLSEPFGAVPSAVRSAPPDIAFELVAALLRRKPPRRLASALAPFGIAALECALRGGVRALVVPHGRSFSRYSRSVASLVPDIDRWHAPPAGLFVLDERLLLLRAGPLRMAAAHEFGHALDAVLAAKPRSYLSFESDRIREAFATATGFVNEYAASGLDEYFAECVRAYVEVNDPRSTWFPLTRHDLLTRDPRMFALVERLFADGLSRRSGSSQPSPRVL